MKQLQLELPKPIALKMIIEIKEDIFLGDDFKGMNTLIQICSYKSRYFLLVDLSVVINTEFYKRLDNDDRDMLNHNFNSFILSQNTTTEVKKLSIGDSQYYVTNKSTNNREFNLEESIVFFGQKVSIILENSLNDAYFIEAIVNNFDDQGLVRRSIDNDWIGFDNMGGCTNLKNFIESKLSAYKRLPKDPHHYLRCFVLLDSDRTNPTLAINYKHLNIEPILQESNIIYHITEKRNMENYMPDDVFREITATENPKWADARLYLSEEQKDFLDISAGFTKKGSNHVSLQKRTDLDIEIQKLYNDVSDANFDILDQSLSMKGFKTNFPKKFVESHNVHKNSLIERTAGQTNKTELKSILDKIYSLI